MNPALSKRIQNIFIPIMLFLIAFGWKYFFIDYRDICMDEPFTIFNAQKSIRDIIDISLQGEPNPPLFMLLMHFWIKLFGIEANTVRLLPLLFNAATVVFIYLTGKRFFSLTAGLVAAALFLFSTYHFFYGLEARTYSLLAFETAAALYFYLRYMENQGDYKALGWLILFNVLMIYSHYFGWFVIFSQFITSFFFMKGIRSLTRLWLPFVFTGLGFVPMVLVIIRQFSKSMRVNWLAPPRSIDYINELYFFFNSKKVLYVAIAIVLISALYWLFFWVKSRKTKIDKRVIVLLIWWFVPYSLMFFISSKIPMFYSRYILFNTIGLYLFIAAVSAVVFQKRRIFEMIAGIILVFMMFRHMQVLPKSYSYREVKNAVTYAEQFENNNSIVLIWPVWCDFEFNYYHRPDIFKNHQNYYDEMLKNDLYRVWGLDHVKSVVKKHPDKRVILFQDGFIRKAGEQITPYLDSAYTKVDSSFFEQTIAVVVYDPKNDSINQVN